MRKQMELGDIFYTIEFQRPGKLKVFKYKAKHITTTTVNGYRFCDTYICGNTAAKICKEKQRQLNTIREDYRNV